ncbi:peroxiredoxin [Mucilaginibacter yixingensis]|uniref:Peroxiredoxin n=1 Tax=Mucilaginibacter yixingensis TaxID=1295612 RepID=A0A2T5JGP7_9SPHI|nr:redoxin domain-containing protein [Mucilaginibacter yixingensis]PTR01610.1 peroxiredoxin [Mucilaginibacter yixingensis]
MSTYAHFPNFELIEIVNELELPFNKRRPLQPLKTGAVVRNFGLDKAFNNWRHFYNGSASYGHLLVRKLLSKPLVISFWSPQWGEYGVSHLRQLNNLQQEIRALGGNLLIITSDATPKQIEDITWANSLSLSFYIDADNTLGKAFGIYSEQNPAWNRYSGIDNNISLLATYVLDAGQQVIYDHIDTDVYQSVNSNFLLAAVRGTSYRQTA